MANIAHLHVGLKAYSFYSYWSVQFIRLLKAYLQQKEHRGRRVNWATNTDRLRTRLKLRCRHSDWVILLTVQFPFLSPFWVAFELQSGNASADVKCLSLMGRTRFSIELLNRAELFRTRRFNFNRFDGSSLNTLFTAHWIHLSYF